MEREDNQSKVATQTNDRQHVKPTENRDTKE